MGLRDLRRRLRVGWGLRRIEVYERIEERIARRLTAPMRRLAIARATRRVPPLRRWEQIPERTFARHAGGGNAVRISRVLDLVPAGCRILDVGIGHGYVAGVLLRDRRPSHYCGVDLREARTEATRAMVEANDLGERSVELVARDLLEVEPGFWRRHDPDIVLLLEVLEHLSEPAGALRAIATAVRPGTRVLFTVPIYGRLEWIWGHRSLFDRRRLERLCAGAGLVIERAEPVQGTWSLVLARRTGERERGEEATGAGTASRAEPDRRYTFSRVRVRSDDAQPDGGVRLRMPGPRVIRLEVGVGPPGSGHRLRIRGLDESGAARIEWAGPAGPAERATYVLRPGKPADSLAPRLRGDPGSVRWIEVSVEAGADPEADVSVHRAAYVAGSPGATPESA